MGTLGAREHASALQASRLIYHMAIGTVIITHLTDEKQKVRKLSNLFMFTQLLAQVYSENIASYSCIVIVC